MQQTLQVKYGNQNSNLNVVGTTANYTEVRNYTIPHGRMFTAGDDERAAALRGARRRGARDARRQPGRDDRPDASRSGASLRGHRDAEREGRRRAASRTPTSRS